MNVPSFSAVVIARNEAMTLPRLVRSLAEFLSAGGELLVVDTGSDDDTVCVGREAGARVVEAGSQFHSVLTSEEAAAIEAKFARKGEGPLVEAGQKLFDFGRARQFAGGLASNDFVWHIDASDVVLAADFDFLDREVRSGRAGSFLYMLRLGTSGFLVARFFDRRLFEWRGRVHEVPVRTKMPTQTVRVTCSEPQLSLRHVRAEKSRNYLAGLALDVIEFPSHQRWRHYLGRELFYMRRYRSAIAVLGGLGRRVNGWAAEKGESLRLVGVCQEALNRPHEAAESYFRAFRIDPSRRQPLLNLASLCQSRGEFQSSVTFAAAALMVPRANPFLSTDESHDSDPHALLYWGLFWLGRREEARVHWENCCRMAPENEKFQQDGRLFGSPPPSARQA